MSGLEFSFEELQASRTFTEEPPSVTTKWLSLGEFHDLTVQNYARMATPVAIATAVGVLYRQNIGIEEVGWRQYIVSVNYGSKKRETGSYTWTFDTTGGTVNIKAALSHVASYPAIEGDENPHKGAIGVSKDNSDVEGTEIIIPALKYTFTFRHPEAQVTIPFTKTLAGVTGRTNAYAYLDHDEGELLYLGSTGSDGSETEAEVAYHFASSANVTDLVIGEIAGIAKKGFEYVWIQFKSAAVAGAASTQPKRVHVEQVYRPADFQAVFGWG